MGGFRIETPLRTGRPIEELARSHDVSASWLFTLLRRYRLEGRQGRRLRPRIRFDRVDKAKRVTLRHRGRFHHIGIGNAHAGWRVAILVDGLEIEIVGLDGSPRRRLVLDPEDYQRIP